MVNKTLLYKNEYKDVEEGTIPKFTSEEIHSLVLFLLNNNYID